MQQRARHRCLPRRSIEHDPEKWKPVFGKDHAQTKSQTLIRLNRIKVWARARKAQWLHGRAPVVGGDRPMPAHAGRSTSYGSILRSPPSSLLTTTALAVLPARA